MIQQFSILETLRLQNNATFPAMMAPRAFDVVVDVVVSRVVAAHLLPLGPLLVARTAGS